MMKVFLTSSVVFLCALGVCYSADTARESKITDGEYAIYSALLRGLLESPQRTKFRQDQSVIVVNGQTELWNLNVSVSEILESENKRGTVINQTLAEKFAERINANSSSVISVIKEKTGSEINKTLADTLITLNEKKFSIENKIVVPGKKVYLLSTQESKEFFKDMYKGWDNFHEKFPGSWIVTLSRVALSEDNSTALLYFSCQYDGTDGEGNYVLMRKENGEWKIITLAMCWLS